MKLPVVTIPSRLMNEALKTVSDYASSGAPRLFPSSTSGVLWGETIRQSLHDDTPEERRASSVMSGFRKGIYDAVLFEQEALSAQQTEHPYYTHALFGLATGLSVTAGLDITKPPGMYRDNHFSPIGSANFPKLLWPQLQDTHRTGDAMGDKPIDPSNGGATEPNPWDISVTAIAQAYRHVTTGVVFIDDIISRLDEQTIERLQRPDFVANTSFQNEKKIIVPILTKQNDVWHVRYDHQMAAIDDISCDALHSFREAASLSAYETRDAQHGMMRDGDVLMLRNSRTLRYQRNTDVGIVNESRPKPSRHGVDIVGYAR